MLEWIAKHRVVLLHQLAHRFWHLDARNVQHCYRVLRSLHARGLIKYASLHPQRGAASRRLVMLTPNGRALLEIPSYPDPMREGRAKLLFRLQVAQLHIDLESQGYLQTHPVDAWEALRRAAAAGLRRVGIRNDADWLLADRIAKAPALPLPFGVWLNAPEDAVVAVAHPTRARFLRAVDRMPDMRILQPVRFLIVTWDTGVAPRAIATMQHALRERGYNQVTVEATDSVLAVRNPATLPPLPVSRYAEHGAPNPRLLGIVAQPSA